MSKIYLLMLIMMIYMFISCKAYFCSEKYKELMQGKYGVIGRVLDFIMVIILPFWVMIYTLYKLLEMLLHEHKT